MGNRGSWLSDIWGKVLANKAKTLKERPLGGCPAGIVEFSTHNNRAAGRFHFSGNRVIGT
jgi:hypothetical protein